MNQNIWGPHCWFFLHTISFNYPNNPTINQKKDYKFFFLALKNIIPCSICRKNYIRHLNEHPIDNHLQSKEELVKWVIDMHNLVNTETGKKNYSYETIIKLYENVYNKKLINNFKECFNNKISFKIKYINVIIFIVIFLAILFFLNNCLK